MRCDSTLDGRCLCGAVTVQVSEWSGEISACHCALCSRWSGGVQMGVAAPRAAVRVTGPVRTHRSSSLAERAWCDTCGSALWFAYVADRDAGHFELAPGLFDNFGGAVLTRVVYADRHPDGVRLEGGAVTRVNARDYEAAHPHVAGDV